MRSAESGKRLNALLAKYERMIRWKVSVFLRGRSASRELREDLFQAGAAALVKASDTFNRFLGVPFQAYLSMKISEALFAEYVRYLPVSGGVFAKQRRLARDVRVLEHIYRRPVSREELADFLAVCAEDLSRLESRLRNDGRPWEPQSYGRDSEAEAHRNMLLARVAELVSALPERERFVFRRLIAEDKSLSEVGRELGVTKQMVWKIKKKLGIGVQKQLGEVQDAEDACELESS